MGVFRKSWCLAPAEVSVISMPNILYENKPKNLIFNLYPEGPHGIRLPIAEHLQNPASMHHVPDCFPLGWQGVLPVHQQ